MFVYITNNQLVGEIPLNNSRFERKVTIFNGNEKMFEAFWVIFIIGLGLFCLTVILVRLWALKKKNYWKKQKMPYVESKLLLGSFASTFVLKKCITDACSNIYKKKEDHVIGKVFQPTISL